MLDLRAGNTVLTGLGQIETAASGGPQFGDHFLVVGIGNLNVDTGRR